MIPALDETVLVDRTGDGRPLLIRRAEPEDRQAIIDNINAICAEQVYLQADFFVQTLDWSAALNGDATDHAVRLLAVAEVEGTVIGHGRVFPSGYGHKDRHVGEVGLVLMQPYRGLRIGTKMLDYLIDWARMCQLEKLTAAVIDGNQRAVHLFARQGFVQEGVRRRQLKIKGSYYNEIFVARFLSDG